MSRIVPGNREATIKALCEETTGGYNVGAARVCMEMEAVHPETLYLLDKYEIYASEIWVAYKDCCGMDVQKLIEELTLRPEELKVHIAMALRP